VELGENMPKILIHDRGMDYWKLVDPTDDELREQYKELPFRGEFVEEEFQEYLKEFREKEAEVVRKNAAQAQKAREEAEKYAKEHPEIKVETEVKSLFSAPKSVPKDASSDKRLAYNRKISQKENDMDDLRNMERNFQERNEQLISSASRYFEESEEYFYERSQYPSRQSNWQQAVIQDAFSDLRSVVDQQDEALEDSCRKARIALEDEVDNLYKERNALPW
jgi:ElaB/YqjD/DUF883 family membrane-anchored ribosome-binding protein